MAESVPEDKNLDDFFAKKDKTKKKAKSRFTPDEIEEQMEKKLKKKAASSKKKAKESGNSGQSSVLEIKLGEEEEWKEVEIEEEKDYSDLRIQNLKISSKEEEDRDRQDNGQSGDEGDERGGKDGPQGPWKPIPSVVQSAPSAAVDSSETTVSAEPEKEAPKSTSKYIPPNLRRAQGQSTPSLTPTVLGGGGRRKKTAPNVNSQDDFPTLGAAAADQGDSVGHEFEKVRGGGRQIEDPSNKREKISLGNKFEALEGKDS